MKDFVSQVKRGIRSSGFLFSMILLLYSVAFVHTDTDVFFRNPVAYFSSRNPYYFYIISYWLGLSRYIIPIVGVLPLGLFLCDDIESNYIISCMYRSGKAKYFANRCAAAIFVSMLCVLIVSVLFTAFLFIVGSPLGGDTEAWLVNRQGTSFEKLATVNGFSFFIISQSIRLMVSAGIFATIAIGYSSLWSQRAFVFVATFGTSLVMDNLVEALFGPEYALWWLQTPDLNTHISLWVVFVRQLLYVVLAVVFMVTSIFFRFSGSAQRLRQCIRLRLENYLIIYRKSPGILLPDGVWGTSIARRIVDVRGSCTWKTLIAAIVVPLIVVFAGFGIRRVRFSIGDLWLGVFGGPGWFEPAVDFYLIGLWVLILLPPMLGTAINMEREVGSRSQITLLRFPSRKSWWHSKCTSFLFYSVICVIVMYSAVAIAGLIAGGRGVSVYRTDSSGFSVATTEVLWIGLIVFILQVIMLTQLQVLVHLVSGNAQLGMLSYVVPLVTSLIAFSSFDKLNNMQLPWNWGILMRSSIFSPPMMEVADHSPIPLCSIPIDRAILQQIIVVVMLFLLNIKLFNVVNITERGHRW